MNLTRTNTTTALAIIPKDTKARVASETNEAAPATTPTDGVDIKGFDGDAIPADDDGPGAGGGYKPLQEPAEGPGAGGGYDGDEIPADDDGPGAGGGYDKVEQDPAESDGPGAGGGYESEESAALTTPGFWNQPLTVFSATGTHEITAYNGSEYTPHWVQVLPQDAYSWSTNASTGLGPLTVDAQGNVVALTPEAKKQAEAKKESGK